MTVVLVNSFHLRSGKAEDFTRAWTDIATYMEMQPGFVRTRFSRSLADSDHFVNVAVWTDAASFREVVSREAFQRLSRPLSELASGSPELFETVYES